MRELTDPRSKLYFAEVPAANLLKIGVSVDPIKRKAHFHLLLAIMGIPNTPVEYIGWVPGEYADESAVRLRFSRYKVRGSFDWFHDNPEMRHFIASLPLEHHAGGWYSLECGCSVCLREYPAHEARRKAAAEASKLDARYARKTAEKRGHKC